MVIAASSPDRDLLMDAGSPTDTDAENRRQTVAVGEVHGAGVSTLVLRSPEQYDQTIHGFEPNPSTLGHPRISDPLSNVLICRCGHAIVPMCVPVQQR
jgi:hypothetical protein